MENLYREASRSRGATGETLVVLLESRLDNIVYRMGLAPTREAARQIVVQKHIQVNDRVVNIPSYRLRPGDRVKVFKKSRMKEAIRATASAPRGPLAPYLRFEWADLEGVLASTPTRAEIPEDIDERRIVEYFSK